jgi:hypothetical protein
MKAVYAIFAIAALVTGYAGAEPVADTAFDEHDRGSSATPNIEQPLEMDFSSGRSHELAQAQVESIYQRLGAAQSARSSMHPSSDATALPGTMNPATKSFLIAPVRELQAIVLIESADGRVLLIDSTPVRD